MRGRPSTPILLACLAAVAVTQGCVVAVRERPARAVYVPGPPPKPLGDVPSGPPSQGLVWIAGYWHWNGVHYVWIPGHWEAPPAAGSAWVPPSYGKADGRHVYETGRWSLRR